jgi:hypothetical protein
MRWTSVRAQAARAAVGLCVLAMSVDARADFKELTVGEPVPLENLTLFPLFAQSEQDVGPLVTLEEALRSGSAEVREVGPSQPRSRGRAPRSRPELSGYESAEVNRLYLQNKGKVPVYVLAGTVVKGGQQDRQVGQDFIVEPGQTAAIDAFCVEHGRWTNQREGAATGGKFSTARALATSEVRAAGQYAQSQSAVWDKVSEVNRAHKKEAPSGTLNATLDDGQVARRTKQLAAQIQEGLAAAASTGNLVGFAYALDGQMRSVRWFASHRVFGLFRDSLVDAAALDALTRQAEHGQRTAPKVAKTKVGELVESVEAAEAAQRDTQGANVNEYKEGGAGYGSKTRLKAAPASARALSEDYVAK